MSGYAPQGAAPSSILGGWARRVTRAGIVREIAETFGTRIVLIVAGLVSSVLTARILGPEGRGVVAVAAAASALCVQFGNLGLHASNTYTVAKDSAAIPALVANSLLASVLAGAVGALVVTGLNVLDPAALSMPPLMQRLVAISIPLGIAYLLLQNLLIGAGRIREYNAVEIAVKLGGLALLVALAIGRRVSPAAVFAITVAVSALGCAVLLPMLARGAWARTRPDGVILRATLRYGIKAYLSALFAYVTLRFDLLMVQHYRGSTDAGYYAIAASYGDLVYLLPTVVGTVLFPRLSALATDHLRWELTRRALPRLGGLMLVGIAVAALLAPAVVRILFGTSFLPAIPAILWLMPGLAALSVNTVLMNYFASLGMPLITVVAPALAGASNIAMNAVLIPRMGIVGASIASTIAYALMLGLSVIYIAARREA